MLLMILLLFHQWGATDNFQPADQLVFTYETDRGVDARIYLAYQADELPDFYYCALKTPICLENLCNPVEIRLEWDLLGNFKDYRETPGKELTKFDHEPFEPKDYEQLKTILADKESFLQDYQMEDLVDTTVKVYSAEIDGLTAATSATFTDKLIPGAIYTCYTLWHLVNGEISDRILANTKSVMDRKLKRNMLLSGIVAYGDFILDGMPEAEKEFLLPDLMQLIPGKNRFIAIKSIRKLPDAAHLGKYAPELIDHYDKVKLPVQQAILQYFLKEKCSAELLKAWIPRAANVPGSLKLSLYQLFEKNLSVLDEPAVRQLREVLEQKQGSPDGHDKKMIALLSNR